MTSRQLSSLIILFICLIKLQGQNNRWINYNQIGWYNYFGTFKLNPKFSLHTEYQFRRNNFITDWQQSLLRVGINYELNSAIQLRVGYGNIETFNYGDIPINKFGKNFTEHRSYVAITLKQTLNKIDVSQRYKLEQRWVGQYSDSSSKQEDKYTYLNRMRYMLRIQIPLTKTDSLKKNQFKIKK